MNKSIVSLSFDDGWKSAITNAYPILDRHKLPATFYIISDCLDDNKYPKYMNVSDLHTLVSSGHEIGSHTISHPHLPELTEAEAWREIIQGRDDLRAHVFNPRTFAYPYGEWTPAIVKQVREAGFLAARSIIEGYNHDRTNPLLLECQHVIETTPLKQIEEWITKAQEKKNWLILMFHQVEEADVLQEKGQIYGTTPDILEKTCQFLKRENSFVLTIEEAIGFTAL